MTLLLRHVPTVMHMLQRYFINAEATARLWLWKDVVKDELMINRRINRCKNNLYFRDWMVNYPKKGYYMVVNSLDWSYFHRTHCIENWIKYKGEFSPINNWGRFRSLVKCVSQGKQPISLCHIMYAIDYTLGYLLDVPGVLSSTRVPFTDMDQLDS